jgi:PhzF family phenazine biosynthesis protein
LRIFTTARELPFAGHPTIGSAHAALEGDVVTGEPDAFVQDCLSGLIHIRKDASGAVHARVPRPGIVPKDINGKALNRSLGSHTFIEPMLIDVGPHWLVARLGEFDALYSVEVDTPRLVELSKDIDATGVTVYAVDEDSEIHVRSFAPIEGVSEDPVCGSGNAAVAAHVKASGLYREVGEAYTAHQGAALGRDGRIRIAIEGDDVSIGGYSVTVVDGKIAL